VPPFLENYGPWALVTGASSGIGLEFSRTLAARGLNLVLVARRLARLQELARTLATDHRIEVRPVQCDLGQHGFVSDVSPAVADIEVGLLINNAGFSNTGELVENPLSRELDLLHVNCRAPLILSHMLGGAMKRRGRGGIVFVSSVAGFAAMPLWANYSASKAYALFLGEALHEELRPHGVDVVTVCPGPTKTEFEDVAHVDFGRLSQGAGVLTAGDVVAAALSSLGHRSTVVVGTGNKLTALSPRLMPRRMATRMFGQFVQKTT
jgi:short-subunit dehydrogenase